MKYKIRRNKRKKVEITPKQTHDVMLKKLSYFNFYNLVFAFLSNAWSITWYMFARRVNMVEEYKNE